MSDVLLENRISSINEEDHHTGPDHHFYYFFLQTIFCSLKLDCLEVTDPDLRKLVQKFHNLMSRDFSVNIDHVMTARHYKVTLSDGASKSKTVNKEFDELFFKDFDDQGQDDDKSDLTCPLENSSENLTETETEKEEDEDERKLGFRKIQITHFKNPSSIYIRNTKLVFFICLLSFSQYFVLHAYLSF